MNEYEALFYSDALSHHGVLGMHWGIRRYQNPDGSYKPGAEGRYAQKVNGNNITPSEDYVRSRAKKRQEMSDDELKAVVQRLNNESQYEQNINKLEPKESLLKNKKDKSESEDAKNARKFDAKMMSNEELKEAVDRLEKEKRYSDLQRELDSPINRWIKDTTKSFLKDIGDAVVNEIKKETKDYLTGEKTRKEQEASYNQAKKEADRAADLLKKHREEMKNDEKQLQQQRQQHEKEKNNREAIKLSNQKENEENQRKKQRERDWNLYLKLKNNWR